MADETPTKPKRRLRPASTETVRERSQKAQTDSEKPTRLRKAGKIFKPLQPVELAEGQRVQVTLPLPPPGPVSPEKAREILRFFPASKGRAGLMGLTEYLASQTAALGSMRDNGL